MTEKEKVAILMVCMGNICRSPTAEAVLRHKLVQRGLADHVRVDSAGTHAWHTGEAPDHRSRNHAARRGYDLTGLRARLVQASDFERFDLLLAMDDGNLANLVAACPAAHHPKLRLLMEFAPKGWAREVPDPYGSGPEGFEQVLDLVESACEGLLPHLRQPEWRQLLLDADNEFGAAYKQWQSRMDIARQKLRIGDILVLAGETPVRELALEARVHAGRSMVRMQQFGFALEQFDAALAIDPDHLVARQQRAICLGRLRRIEEAREGEAVAHERRTVDLGEETGLEELPAHAVPLGARLALEHVGAGRHPGPQLGLAGIERAATRVAGQDLEHRGARLPPATWSA